MGLKRVIRLVLSIAILAAWSGGCADEASTSSETSAVTGTNGIWQNASFAVTVRDTTPPVVTVPSPK